jgi:HK97 family phage prohead protease
MPELEHVRSVVVGDMEVQGRTLEGQALTFDTLYRVSDDGRRFYQEGFRRGAFSDAIESRRWFELRPEHYDDRIGSVHFRESATGLVFVATMEPGDRGDDELELVRSGRRAGVSIRYRTVANERGRAAPPWWRTKVDLRELSLTARPQYGPDAKVLALRSQAPTHDAELAGLLAWVPPEV